MSTKRIAVFHPSEKPEAMTVNGRRTFKALFSELSKQGYVEGRNLIIERYSALGRPEAYATVAQAIVHSHPDAIVALSGPIARQLKALTESIPIVTATADPVGGRLVASMAKPGANITGVSVDTGGELNGKRLQLLRETVPKLNKVRVLVPATNLGIWPAHLPPLKRIAEQASVSIDLAVIEGEINSEAYARVFDALSKEGVGGLIVGDGAENITYGKTIANLAASHRLPAIYTYREPVEVGGLMSYGVDLADVLKRLADITSQILSGYKPGDIPFYQ